MVSKSAVRKQNSLFRRNQAEHRVQALALCTIHVSYLTLFIPILWMKTLILREVIPLPKMAGWCVAGLGHVSRQFDLRVLVPNSPHASCKSVGTSEGL